MRYDELEVGMRVRDGAKFGMVEKIYLNSVHVRWGLGEKWIYDRSHLQFLSRAT